MMFIGACDRDPNYQFKVEMKIYEAILVYFDERNGDSGKY